MMTMMMSNNNNNNIILSFSLLLWLHMTPYYCLFKKLSQTTPKDKLVHISHLIMQSPHYTGHTVHLKHQHLLRSSHMGHQNAACDVIIMQMIYTSCLYHVSLLS